MIYKEHIFKKKYGQNFLKDENILRKIVTTADITQNDLVIEIGSGSGALTKYLCLNAKYVISYEIDSSLEDTLYKNLKDYNNVRIIWDDFLKRNIKEDISDLDYDKIYVIANLPYYITTPIINKIISSGVDINKLVIMIQKEVGDRIISSPGSREYGSLTVFLNYYFNIKKEFLVNRNCFFPQPNVDSIVISLTKKDMVLDVKNEELLFTLIRDSFQYKRKNLKNNLKHYNLKKIDEILSKYNFDTTVRAEQLDLKIFIDIANNI